MPIEFSFLWKIADPAFAIGVGLSLIAFVTALCYFPARRFPAKKRQHYQRILALLAEILVSVGIIGLFTFAARVKIDTEIGEAEKQAQELQRQVNVATWEFARVNCLEFPEPLIPTRQMSTIYAACKLWPEIINSPTHITDWFGAKDKLVEISNTEGLDRHLKASYRLIANNINLMIEAQDEAARDRHKKRLLESAISWSLVSACAVLATIGVALKWTRVLLDFRRD